MSAVFDCPHCGKKYPKKSSLIGRKLRCSDCKGVFQLQGDGNAIKVSVEEKSPQDKAQDQAAAKSQVSNQLTQRSKRVNKKSLTARVEKSRLSLRDAASAALSQVTEESRQESKPLKPELPEPKKQPSLEVYRSKNAAANTNASGFKPFIYVGICALIIIGIIYSLPEQSPQQAAVEAFSQRVGQELSTYPLRMQTYRARMWVYSRDSYEFPAIILNADVGTLSEPIELPWEKMTEVCQQHFGGMSLMPAFALMVESNKQAMLEEIWEDYQEKFYLEGFYKRLRQKNIRYIHCRKIPKLLKEAGLSERDIYIVGLLLAGTSDEAGTPCSDFGLISSIKAQRAQLCTLHGREGLKLVERGNDYEVLSSTAFSGLVLGFSGIPGRADEWRILDIRQGLSMEEFYQDRFNPFTTLSTRLRENITRQHGEPEPEANPELERLGN